MLSRTTAVLFICVSQTQAKDAKSVDRMVDSVVDKLVNKILKTWPANRDKHNMKTQSQSRPSKRQVSVSHARSSAVFPALTSTFSQYPALRSLPKTQAQFEHRRRTYDAAQYSAAAEEARIRALAARIQATSVDTAARRAEHSAALIAGHVEEAARAQAKKEPRIQKAVAGAASAAAAARAEAPAAAQAADKFQEAQTSLEAAATLSAEADLRWAKSRHIASAATAMAAAGSAGQAAEVAEAEIPPAASRLQEAVAAAQRAEVDARQWASIGSVLVLGKQLQLTSESSHLFLPPLPKNPLLPTRSSSSSFLLPPPSVASLVTRPSTPSSALLPPPSVADEVNPPHKNPLLPTRSSSSSFLLPPPSVASLLTPPSTPSSVLLPSPVLLLPSHPSPKDPSSTEK
eukprot:gnl/MRDRNA2_/MRDRNA2_79998_c0_seq2.p1 gnl/MRDRNA2_/MRDRNA2_79998_c0~~gnl/MRDRNA2_/MRDRNA2_79998_c0_seq2.p1  ORF type:complete len:402 (+),score=67.88 gnl/MRDRNA2_/MRDRNA2_79998_c0_seq2:131-1336(+)